MREPRLLLLDIREAIDDILAFTRCGRADFMASKVTQLAVVRCFEVIGEAAKNLPDDLRSHAPGIPWRRLAGFRDVLIHAYHRVDLELVWQVVENELPALRRQIAALIEGADL